MERLKFKLVFDRRKVIASPKDKGAVEVYIYDPVRKKTRYILTGVAVTKAQFEHNSNYGGCVVKHVNAGALNRAMMKVYAEVEAFGLSDQCQKIEDIAKWNIKAEQTTLVIDFIKEHLLRKKLATRAAAHHKVLIHRIAEFGKIKVFADLTYENIIDFDYFLRDSVGDRQGISEVTAHKRHSMFQSYIKEVEITIKQPPIPPIQIDPVESFLLGVKRVVIFCL